METSFNEGSVTSTYISFVGDSLTGGDARTHSTYEFKRLFQLKLKKEETPKSWWICMDHPWGIRARLQELILNLMCPLKENN